MNLKYYKRRYCTEIEKVENYEKAVADNFISWVCHHRLQTWNSDGERRLVDIKAEELKALGMYYNRPAEELIFLTVAEHEILHKKGKHRTKETRKKMSIARKGKPKSEETRKKISEASKGKPGTMKGKHHSDETRRKISESRKGKHLSEEHKKKLSKAHKGKKLSEEVRKKMSVARKGIRWYNNGKINIRSKKCPEGFVPGMLRK